MKELSFNRAAAECFKNKQAAQLLLSNTIRTMKDTADDVTRRSYVDFLERTVNDALEVIYRPEHTDIEKVFLACTLLTLLVDAEGPVFAFVLPANNMEECRRRASRLRELSDRLARHHENELDIFEENRGFEWYESGMDEEVFAEREAEVRDYNAFLNRMYGEGEITAEEFHDLRYNTLLYSGLIRDVIFVTPQVSFPDVIIDGKSIRCDVVIWSPYDELFNLVVECDGYDTHSLVECDYCGQATKSKQEKGSFIRDRKRDRELLRRGYPVLRYSGSELNEDVFACARDVGAQIHVARVRHLLVRRGLESLDETSGA